MADEPAVQSGQFQMRDIHILLQDAHFMNVPKASHSVNRTPVRIAGNIECIRVSGMESEKSEIELKNSYLKKIILIENLKENIVVDNKATSNVSFKLLNDQLYIITKKNSASVAYAPRYYYNNGYYYNGYYGNISTVPRDNEFGPPKLYVTKGERLENKYVKMRNHDSYGIQFTVLPTQ